MVQHEQKIYTLPDDLIRDKKYQENEVIIHYHYSRHSTSKNRIRLKRHMITLMISGSKKVVFPEYSQWISDQEMVIFTKSHLLTSEIVSDLSPFKSIVIYFDDQVLNDFLIQNQVKKTPGDAQVLILQKDPFLNNFTDSLQLLLERQTFLSPAFKLLKLQELLMYLIRDNRERFLSLKFQTNPEHLRIREIVTSHIHSSVTVDELAFLCGMSTSSFKRKFELLYHMPPRQWLTSQKLKLACDLLKSPENIPSQVYLKVGYQSHSSFTKAFKDQYGMTPGAFHLNNLNQ